MNNLIEKLKDKTYVRAFGLMTQEEQECFEEVKSKNCLWYHGNGSIGWAGNSGAFNKFDKFTTYAIKPDYRPEPEYVDLEIIELNQDAGKWLGVLQALEPTVDFLPYSFTHLHCLSSLPNFEEFHTKHDKGRQIILSEHVANRISLGKTVFARFRVKKCLNT